MFINEPKQRIKERVILDKVERMSKHFSKGFIDGSIPLLVCPALTLEKKGILLRPFWQLLGDAPNFLKWRHSKLIYY